MTTPLHAFGPRLLAGFGTLTLLGGIGLLSSRPARTAGGPVPVNVSNLPLPTTPTDLAAPSQPFQASTTYEIKPGLISGSVASDFLYTDITVPAGKRLVIQTVGVERNGVANYQTLRSDINTTVNGKTVSFPLPLVPYDFPAYPGVTQSMTLYSDGGTVLTFYVVRSGTVGTEFVNLRVSGYLVNMP